jgi:hypothetical protein
MAIQDMKYGTGVLLTMFPLKHPSLQVKFYVIRDPISPPHHTTK